MNLHTRWCMDCGYGPCDMNCSGPGTSPILDSHLVQGYNIGDGLFCTLCKADKDLDQPCTGKVMQPHEWTEGASLLLSYIKQKGGHVGIITLQRDMLTLRSFPKLEKHGLAEYCDHMNLMATAVRLTIRGVKAEPPVTWRPRPNR